MAKPYIDLDLTGLPGVDPQRIVEELVRAGRDVVVCLEEQETRRQEISARERVALADLADRRELLRRYLQESFGEHGDDYVRIAVVENEQRIRQAARNLRKFWARGEPCPVARRGLGNRHRGL